MTGLIIAGVLLWLFWPEKTRWTPFGGAFKHDRKTGRLTVAVQLPTKRKSKARRRK